MSAAGEREPGLLAGLIRATDSFITRAAMVLLVLIGVPICIFLICEDRLDRESRRYVDAAVPQIVANWSAGELRRRLVPEARTEVMDEKAQKLFAIFGEALGKLRRYQGARGKSVIFLANLHVEEISAHYVAKADFEKASAIIRVYLVRRDGEWEITSMRVESEALPRPAAAK